jgi:hypothetical protein
MRRHLLRSLRLVAVIALALLLSACGRNMAEQARLDPLQASPFFPDGTGQRPLLEGTVSRERGGVALRRSTSSASSMRRSATT